MRPDTNGKGQQSFSLRYANIINSLRSDILSGVIQPGDLIESEHELTQRFQVSRSSVRKALAELTAAGLIVKKQGKGTFVADKPNQQADHVITIAAFTPNYDMGTVYKLISLFEETHPKVKVQLLELPTIGYLNAIRQYESKVDLMLLSDSMFRGMNQREELQVLPSLVTHTNAFHQAAYQPFHHPDGEYAVPIMFSPVVLSYHKAHFDQAGLPYPDENWTWADLLANALQLTSVNHDSQVTTRFGFQFSQSVTRFSLFLLQHEAMLQDDTGRPTLDNERVREVVEFCTRLMYRYRVSPVCLGGNERTPGMLFSSGQIAMTLTTLHQINSFPKVEFAWGIAPPAKDRRRGSIIVSIGLAMPRQAPRPDLAAEFIKFMTSSETQHMLKKISMSLPVLAELLTDGSEEQPDLPVGAYNICNQVCDYATTMDTLGTKWLTLLRDELVLTWGNMETSAQGCARAQAKAMRIFNSGRA